MLWIRPASRSILAFILFVGAFAAIAARAEEGTFDSDGVKIRYVAEGNGEPVILIHGFAANVEMMWRMSGTLAQLAEHHRVIALDCRGHGQSDKPHEPEKYGVNMVQDVARLMDHLKIEKAHLVGYSMGGAITLKFATLYPDRVISAIPCGFGWVRPSDVDAKGHLSALVDSLESGGGFDPLIQALIPPDEPQPTPDQMRGLNQMLLMMNDAKALAAVARGIRELGIEEKDLARLKAPTLVIIGSKDTLKPDADRLAKARPDVQVKILEGDNHMTTFQDPELGDAIEQFLKDQAAAPTMPAESAKPKAASEPAARKPEPAIP